MRPSPIQPLPCTENPETSPPGAGFPIRSILIEQLRLNDGTQTRAELNQDAVEDYAEKLEERGASIFPPVVVFGDEEHGFWLADGFHRVWATQNSGKKKIKAEIRPGDRLAALLYSLGANSAHGVRRTNADKRLSVLLALSEQSLRDSSNHVLADLCGVSNHLVAEVRRDQKPRADEQVRNSPTSRTPSKRKGRDGKMHPVGKSRRGKKPIMPVPNHVEPLESEALVSGEGASCTPPVAQIDISRGTNGSGEQLSSAASVDAEDLEHKPERTVGDDGSLPEATATAGRGVTPPADTLSEQMNSQPQIADPARWNDGIIGWERVEERLARANEVHPSNRYTDGERQAFMNCFTELARAVNRLAEVACVARGVRTQVATDSALALAKFISTSPGVTV